MEDEKFTKLETKTFVEVEKKERQVQQIFKNQINIISDDILIIAEEYGNWEDSRRRIDLLGLDRDGSLVVIELKRDKKNAYMDLQALRYAAMVSTLTIEDVVEALKKYQSKEGITHDKEAKEQILDHLSDHSGNKPSELSNNVKIILVNEDFLDTELTTTILWLIENYDIDITCFRLTPCIHNQSTLVDVQQIIPIKESKDYQIKKRNKIIKEQTNRATKDTTKYRFEGKIYGKGQLVLAVVTSYVKAHPNITYDGLKNAFPKPPSGRKHEVFESVEQIKMDKATSNDRRDRYFLEDDKLLPIADDTIAVSNQWGIGNINPFLDNARELKLVIETVTE